MNNAHASGLARDSRIIGFAVMASALGGWAVSCGPGLFNPNGSPAVTPSPAPYIYGQGPSGDVVGYQLNATSGALSLVTGSPFVADSSHTAADYAATPSGSFLFVANQSSNTVSSFAIASNGALTQVSGSPYATGNKPSGMTVDPTGQFLLVTNQTDSTVSVFSINSSSGALTAVTGSPFSVAGGTGPGWIAIDPSDHFAYVLQETTGTLDAYSFNSTSGALGSELVSGGAPYSLSGNGGNALMMDPAGQYVYAAGSSGIYSFSRNTSTGALTAVTGSPFATGDYFTHAVLSASGKFLFATEGAGAGGTNLVVYSLSAGTPTAVTAFALPSATPGYQVVVDPTTSFAYVTSTAASNEVLGFSLSSQGLPTALSASPFFAGGQAGGNIVVDVPQ